jgi:hypothetical protein
MAPDPASAPEGQSLRSFLERHARKVVTALAVAILGGAGLAITSWVKDKSEETTSKVLVSLSGGPIDVRVVPEGQFASGHAFAPYYVVPRAELASPSQVSDAELARVTRAGSLDPAWAEGHGGMAGSPQIVRLELSGKGDRKVTITGLRPRVMSTDAPMRGWYVASPGCGAQPVRIADLDLDAPRPVRGFFDEGGRRRHLALSVTKTDREQLELHASTRRAAIAWKAELFYASPDGSGSVLIPEGEPFRVTTETASDGFRPDFSGGSPSVAREPGWDKGITAC